MRLINAHTYKLETFPGSHIPPYAILSHTWGEDEVTIEQMLSETADTESDGYQKIIHTCEQAVADGLEYVWIDTCCIDKSNAAELEHAINAMFDWYHRAELCYAHLADVQTVHNPDKKGSEFRRSRWFRRGWTLQELLAPTKLEFYSETWEYIGPVTALYSTIESITGIESFYLQRASSPHTFMFRNASIAARMSWASMRHTSIAEDRAYCLLGIFDIKIPLMYGEGGSKAFYRLQEEIIKQSDDQTILAWGWKRPLTPPSSPGPNAPLTHGFLAASPASFAGCQDLTRWPGPGVGGRVFPINHKGLHITVPLRHDGGNRYTAMLRCCSKMNPDKAIGLPLVKDKDDDGDPKGIACYLRAEENLADNCAKLNPKWPPTTICISHRPWYPKMVVEVKSWSQGFYLRSLPTDCVIQQVYPSSEWSPDEHVMTIEKVDINEPRIFCGSCGSGDFIVMVRWLRNLREWKCGIARRWNPGEKLTEAELELLMFSNRVMLEHSRVEVSMRKTMIANKELMTLDVIEKGFEELEEYKDEREQDVSAVFSIIWGLGAACAVVPYLMHLRKKFRAK
ncbi:Vegetative incompatibility protein HET-E-1 [Cladobotryum mycophilum]|uniref:Vegetative incompatibility protein HET-E-1 n=1 Tax=Cladobotryum mycophilum TaxID=491253 RepID=A0ABR0T424_9HYPO